MLFPNGYKITQIFGARPEYYGQFGLKGHEGLDVIPKDSDWRILCVADGVVVKDEDNPRSGAYGDYVTVWHPSLKKATQYCHMVENYVSLNDQVKAGGVLGKMGATGNAQGAHLHINVYEVDDNGVRLNRNNGYNGGVDPLPFLNTLDASQGGSMPTGNTVNITTAKFTELVQKSTQWDTVADTLNLDKLDQGGGKKVVDIVNDLKSNVDSLNKDVTNLRESLTTTNTQVIQLNSTIVTRDSSISELNKQVETLTKNLNDSKKEIDGLKEEIKKLQELPPEVVPTEPTTPDGVLTIVLKFIANVWAKIKDKKVT